jgi:hypothetical protein
MRLFKNLAYFVKLIMKTITDIIPFMLMMLIIIAAFAQYFYVVNNNVKYIDPNSDVVFFDEYVGNNGIDVLISVYLMGAIGAFNSGLFRAGLEPDRHYAIIMFLLATFIIQVVFMNMLIAIMGDTFGQVSEASTESGIREQVVLISDHAWLLDLAKIFKGKKYIIRVRPSSS